jgi:hypothetical protein
MQEGHRSIVNQNDKAVLALRARYAGQVDLAVLEIGIIGVLKKFKRDTAGLVFHIAQPGPDSIQNRALNFRVILEHSAERSALCLVFPCFALGVLVLDPEPAEILDFGELPDERWSASRADLPEVKGQVLQNQLFGSFEMQLFRAVEFAP